MEAQAKAQRGFGERTPIIVLSLSEQNDDCPRLISIAPCAAVRRYLIDSLGGFVPLVSFGLVEDSCWKSTLCRAH